MPTPEDTPTEEMFFMQMCDLMWGEELFVANNQGTNSSKFIVVYENKNPQFCIKVAAGFCLNKTLFWVRKPVYSNLPTDK